MTSDNAYKLTRPQAYTRTVAAVQPVSRESVIGMVVMQGQAFSLVACRSRA